MPDDAPEQSSQLGASPLLGVGRLTMSSELDGSVHTIRLAGELDLDTADVVQQELERVEASEARSIVVDLSGLTFMSTVGVRLVLSADARLRQDAGRLRLVRGPAAVQRVFEMSGVEDQLPFAD